jgi:hypothetical protein
LNDPGTVAFPAWAGNIYDPGTGAGNEEAGNNNYAYGGTALGNNARSTDLNENI